MTKLRIGQFLVAEGLLSDEEVIRALVYQRSSTEPLRLGSILLNWDVLTEEAFLAALAKFHGCAYVTWAVLSRASAHALRNLPALQAIRLEAVPYAIDSGVLRVAFRNPSDLAVIDEASKIAGRRVVPAASTEVRLALAQHRFYGNPMPFQFKPILQRLERRTVISGGKALVGAAPREVAGAAVPSAPVFTYEEPAAEPAPAGILLSEVADSGEPEILPPPETIPPIEIPTFPAVGKDAAAGESRAGRSRDEILSPIVETLLRRFSRVLFFGVGKSAITAWAGGGPGLTAALVARIQIPRAEESVLAEVAASGVPQLGPVERERFPRGLRAILRRDACECAVFPIRVLDSVAGLLYADHLGVPLPSGDFAVLARASAAASGVLSEFLRRGGGEE